jgi:signal transduction histidine kinase
VRQIALVGSEEKFDRLSRLATRILHAPVALVSLVDADRQIFKGCIGLPEPWHTRRETPLSHSFCQHTVMSSAPLIIEDARTHPLVADNLAIRDLQIVAYAGIPLRTQTGEVLGSFCVIDTQPRRWTVEELAILQDLAASAVTEIELVAKTAEAMRSMREAKKRAAQVETILEAITDGILVFDAEGRVVAANAAGQRLLPDSLAEFRAFPLEDRVAPTGHADNDARPLLPKEWPIQRLLRGETLAGDAAQDLTVRLPDGGERHLSVGGAPIRDADGQVTGAVSVSRDVTERRRIANEREHLLGVVSHELKSPLTAIRALEQLAYQRLSRAHRPEAELLQRLGASTKRVERLVDDLVDAARMETGGIKLQTERCDLVALCAAAAEERTVVVGRSVTVEYEPGSLLIEADPVRIRQIIDNLLSNALKYSPAETPVTLTVRRERDVAHVSVRDEGPGIPAARVPYLFDRFYRVPGIEVQHGTGVGLGLGLYLCRHLLQLQGGHIGVKTKEGQGSTFWFTLPKLDERTPDEAGQGDA